MAEYIDCNDAESIYNMFPLQIELLLNGWRRCSNLFYQICEKPEKCIERPIILPVPLFEPTTSQKRVFVENQRIFWFLGYEKVRSLSSRWIINKGRKARPYRSPKRKTSPKETWFRSSRVDRLLQAKNLRCSSTFLQCLSRPNHSIIILT